MIRIQMMRSFLIEVDGAIWDSLEQRSPQGMRLVRRLIMERGKPVSDEDMGCYLNKTRKRECSFTALKTLVCRTRGLLKEVHPALAACLIRTDNGYRWALHPEIYIDVLELADLFDELAICMTAEKLDELLKLYSCNLPEKPEWEKLYTDYAVQYASTLNKAGDFQKAYEVCATALKLCPGSELLRILQQEADAGRRPFMQIRQDEAEEPDKLYQGLIPEDKAFIFSLDAMHHQLMQKKTGPYFCDVEAFKKIYSLMLELPSNTYLGILTVSGPSSVSREGAMTSLNVILRDNLQGGDIITKFSANITAVLLNGKNYDSGREALNRIQRLFYAVFPEEYFSFFAEIRPLFPDIRERRRSIM